MVYLIIFCRENFDIGQESLLDRIDFIQQRHPKIKEIRLRPQIDDHDLSTKLNQGKKFLSEGAKLKVTLMFRGREMSRVDLDRIVMERVLEELSDVAEVEKDIPLEGRRMSVILNAK